MKKIPFLATTILLLVGVSCLLACNNTRNGANVASQLSDEQVASAILSYAADPMFSSGALLEAVTGVKAELELVDVNGGKTYFSMPPSEKWRTALSHLSGRHEAVEWAKQVGPYLQIDDIILPKKGVYFFRIDSADFKVDPNARLKIVFEHATYEPLARELASYIRNDVLVGGKVYFAARYEGNQPVLTSNFGARVTIPGEPSLTRFVKEIVGTEQDLDQISQKLLNFVTNEIEYDYDELEWSDHRQVVKRANEVLMTRRATCASKAALYASLFEQIGVEYILAYYPEHLAVFVSGSYPDTNGYSLVRGGKRYYLAESTVPGFVIGETKLRGNSSLATSWTHLQRPKEREVPKPKT